VRAPVELTLLGKTLLNLDQIGRVLDPDLNVNAAIRESAVELLGRRLRKSVSAGGVFSAPLEAKEFAACRGESIAYSMRLPRAS
jgi:ubiquinone biosynthesis protein